MPVQKVKFNSAGVNCAGDLYIPENYRPGSRCPALVIGHGFSMVKQGLVDEGGTFPVQGMSRLRSITERLGKARASRAANSFR